MELMDRLKAVFVVSCPASRGGDHGIAGLDSSRKTFHPQQARKDNQGLPAVDPTFIMRGMPYNSLSAAACPESLHLSHVSSD
jgi:hypothetical protein